jgi:hypothetical protein
MLQRRLAREWLWLLGCGLGAALLFAYSVYRHEQVRQEWLAKPDLSPEVIMQIASLVESPGWPVFGAQFAILYGASVFVRVTIWAVKTARRRI